MITILTLAYSFVDNNYGKYLILKYKFCQNHCFGSTLRIPHHTNIIIHTPCVLHNFLTPIYRQAVQLHTYIPYMSQNLTILSMKGYYITTCTWPISRWYTNLTDDTPIKQLHTMSCNKQRLRKLKIKFSNCDLFLRQNK